jgi:hypothetical protein
MYGEEIAATCHRTYQLSSTKLGPDQFWFDENYEALGAHKEDK